MVSLPTVFQVIDYKLPNIADSVLHKQFGNSVEAPAAENCRKHKKVVDGNHRIYAFIPPVDVS